MTGETRQEPSVSLAYDIAIHSYDVIIGRINAMDSKLQSLITFSCAITLVVPVLIQSSYLARNTAWLVAVLLLFATTVSLALYAMFALKKGAVIVLDPKVIFESYLDMPEDEFKRAITKSSGEHFDRNDALVIAKWEFCKFVCIAITIECVLIVLWSFYHS